MTLHVAGSGHIVVLGVAVVLFASGCGGSGSDASGEGGGSSSATSSVSSSSDAVSSAQSSSVAAVGSPLYRIPDTGQQRCFDDSGSEVACAQSGQDGAYESEAPSYVLEGGIVRDLVTGLMWQHNSDLNDDRRLDTGDKLSADEAVSYCASLSLGGFDDWRLPDIKALYSLIDFSGEDVSGLESADTAALAPFIDTKYFLFAYGDVSAGERIIDSQWATSTDYVSTVMGGQPAMFGVNFADGRIKGYPRSGAFFVRCVRGNADYGVNRFEDNGDGTVSDTASGRMWQRGDSGTAMGWSEAIAFCEQETTGGYDDWRLPDAKELQNLVDYDRAPDTTDSAAIDTDFFDATGIVNEAGASDYGFYWSGTTHIKNDGTGDNAVYVSFGRAMGYMNGVWEDVHGAGAQRSDPKSVKGIDPTSATVDAYGGTAISHGPQGDVIRLKNYVRCVRSLDQTE